MSFMVQTADKSWHKVAPVSQKFTDKLYNAQLKAAVRRNFTQLVNAQPSLSVKWIGVKVYGQRNDPQYITNSLSSIYQVPPTESNALSYPITMTFIAPDNYQFVPGNKDTFKATPTLPTQKAEVQTVTFENGNRSALVTVLFTRASITERGGCSVTATEQKFKRDFWSDVMDIRRKLAAKETNGWAVVRGGDLIDIPLDGVLTAEPVQAPAKLELDIVVQLPLPRNQDPIRLRGIVEKGRITQINGITVEWIDKILRLSLDEVE
jgi:hypothetical protein